MALCGTAVFGSSLSHLTGSPTLYGTAFQLNFNLVNGKPDPNLIRDLEHDPAITGITRGLATAISITTDSSHGKVTLGAIAGTAVRGTLLGSRRSTVTRPAVTGRSVSARRRCAKSVPT
jgi:hypothetical protein